MTQTVLILGASGKIGRSSQAAFARAGWRVKTWNRHSEDLREAARGVDVIVNGLNPPAYHDWARLVPAYTAQVIEAAKASGATVIVPGNVYNFGARGGEWSESTPHEPHTRKGRIREEMERAYAASGVRTIVLRAGNFIDPAQAADVMSLVIMRSIENGRITVPGDATAMQAYCFLPDWAEAAVGLAEKRAELAAFEDVPFPGHAFTLEELRAFVSQELVRPITFARFPWWALTMLGPFWELARELGEMRYLWSTPHTLSGEKLARLLPDFRATPLADVMLAGVPAAMLAGLARGPAGPPSARG